jgi:hypothetical protein
VGNSSNCYCFRCLRVGHFRSSCRCPITCHRCLGLGHITANCGPPSVNLGFQPKVAPTDCFQKEGYDKRKPSKVSSWFLDQDCVGPSSPTIFENFSEFWHALFSPHHDTSATPCTELVIYNAPSLSSSSVPEAPRSITSVDISSSDICDKDQEKYDDA